MRNAASGGGASIIKLAALSLSMAVAKWMRLCPRALGGRRSRARGGGGQYGSGAPEALVEAQLGPWGERTGRSSIDGPPSRPATPRGCHPLHLHLPSSA
eukprot:3610469-Pyramimonas_sp.AAC.1